MMTTRTTFLGLAAAATLLTSCFPKAYADKPARPALAPRASLDPAPYQVELVDESGAVLPTYTLRGRFYVQGDVGRRYSIRITNPTASRVEAVVSVDGLDVVDGRGADFVAKRGYVIPPYGQVVVEGFRTSLADVAAFRFSSVASSYAGRKGRPRNVGVVGVALFAERARPAALLPVPRPEPEPDDDWRQPQGYDKSEAAPTSSSGGGGGGRAGATPSRDAAGEEGAASAQRSVASESRRPSERPGLGTEFGERRDSRVQWVDFERASASRPTAMAELRYNDRDGLIALGIPLGHPVPPEEIETRETANPFPGSSFAQPPR